MSEEEAPEFKRYYCNQCPTNPGKTVSVFRIKDARICLICYQHIKRTSGLDIDKIHDLDSKQAKKHLSQIESKVDESSSGKQRKVRRSRTNVKDPVRS